MGQAVDVQKRQVWWRRLRRFRESGLSVARFCQREQVSVPAFYQWRKKLVANSHGRDGRSSASAGSLASVPASVRVPGPASGPANGFLPVTILSPTQLTRPARVEVRLNNGVRLRVPGGEAETLRHVLRIVSELPAGAARADETEDAAC